MNAYLRAMRLERWPRSLAIFAGAAACVFLRREGPFPNLAVPAARLAMAFGLTWIISTANYIVNEIADLPFDVHHPTKRFRPLVLGEIRQGPFALLGLALIVLGLGGAWVLFSKPMFFSLLGLLAAGFIYNVKPVRTKDIPFLDAISESANNPIRFLIGWYAIAGGTGFPPVGLLASWWAFGNFLMIAKRLSELRFLKEKAGDYRTSHKRYTKGRLLFGMAASAVISLAAFVAFGAAAGLQAFYFIAPFLLGFMAYIVRKTLREAEVMEEPETLFSHAPFAAYLLFLVGLFVLAYLKDAPGR